jgi:hypothetical protein
MIPILVGALGTIVTLLIAHGRATPYDNYVRFAVSLLHGHLWIDPLWPGPYIDAVLFDGHRYIVNDPVPGFLIVPLVAIAGLRANQTLLAAILCGVATGAGWALLARLGVPRRTAVWLLVFLLFGTDLVWCSMLGDVWFIAQTSAVAFALLALVELAGARRGALVALWYALAIGSRFTLVMAVPIVLWWCWNGFVERKRRPRELAAAVLTFVPFAVLWVAYNVARWHVPWDAGHTIFYHEDPNIGSAVGSPFSLANVPMQLWSFFVAPPQFQQAPPYLVPSIGGTALWFTSPALLLAFLARRPKLLVAELWIATFLCAGPSLLYYVNGFAQFGMRHALDFEPFLLVLMALAASRGIGVVWRALIAWSVLAGAWGIWYWNAYIRPGTM